MEKSEELDMLEREKKMEREIQHILDVERERKTILEPESAKQITEFGMGWLPEVPSIMDFTPETTTVPVRLKLQGQDTSIRTMLKDIGVGDGLKGLTLPQTADLRPWFSNVENQLNLGSCTAQAGVGMFEYFQKRALGTYIDLSRIFLYKVTRNLMRTTGDTGAYIRTTMGAMVLFGVPPEKYWPYTDVKKSDPVVGNYYFDQEPPAFCYAFAQNFQALQYFRLDQNITTADLLTRIKTYIAAGLPSMFGFTVYSSMQQAQTTGKIPFPSKNDNIVGGHAVVAAGYDDNLVITHANDNSITTKGALLIRNSWGNWGINGGYLWLPYDYVLKGQTADWWSLLKSEWVDTNVFGF